MPLSNRVCFQVNLRDCLQCRLCGRAPLSQQNYHRGFEYHHLVPQSESGADEVFNLVLLCHDCHTRHHQGRLKLPPLESFGDLSAPAVFACLGCRTLLQSETVEMNCGWYRCHACGQQTHLFVHCGHS